MSDADRTAILVDARNAGRITRWTMVERGTILWIMIYSEEEISYRCKLQVIMCKVGRGIGLVGYPYDVQLAKKSYFALIRQRSQRYCLTVRNP